MNPLTLVKRIQNINSKEAALNISEEASWHTKYKDSAYVFVGGIPFDLTEGDLLAVFAEYGEVVDVNLVRDKGTGKSKGFAFIAYEDQRSTNLAVDNLNGAQVLGRIIRVDHVDKYKKKEEEDEETERQKREARGVCRAFQRGECTRGAGCKFSHDEQFISERKKSKLEEDQKSSLTWNIFQRKESRVQHDLDSRAANTGWGEHGNAKWDNDKYDGPKKERRYDNNQSNRIPETRDRDSRSIAHGSELELDNQSKRSDRREEKMLRRHDDDDKFEGRENTSRRETKGPRRHDDDEFEHRLREDGHRREEKKSRGGYDGREPESRDNRREDRRSTKRDDIVFESKSRDSDARDDRRPK
ncbi:hypothetical protein TSUD_279850 [Trifolium subterraneum]|uniref:C3H1-type domain-containing protein n=1 Tax=Trifolium subterraneum TaxID=3900 RepID=A0A2Z6MJM6_TRISU|nr:hypothetical protein TSUD_279850 [Trifolium subterraneum]